VSAQDVESARVAVVLVVAGVTLFWRFALRATLAIIAIAAILGLLVLMRGIH
jgi:ABC-type multidrug transport system permease subunit